MSAIERTQEEANAAKYRRNPFLLFFATILFASAIVAILAVLDEADIWLRIDYGVGALVGSFGALYIFKISRTSWP